MKSSAYLLGGLFLAVASMSSHAAVALSEEAQEQESAGTILQIGLPLAALGLTFLLDDRPLSVDSLRVDGASGFDADTLIHLNGHPRHDLALAMGRTIAATYALKYSVSEERPNGADNHSFPSGHTSVSFAGAEFIRKEYGWAWGVPAYLAAGFVGYSRVRARDHYTVDVLSGAAIGILSNHDVGKYLTHAGTLTVGPDLIAPRALSGAPYREDVMSTLMPVPALRFELKF